MTVQLVLGIESSCDETGVALYHSEKGLLAHALHSQVSLHNAYGGVVPELASRDHIGRVLPLTRRVLAEGGYALQDLSAIAYTAGPGLAGALLVGASIANALAMALQIPAIPVHHMEAHLLAPMLEPDPPPLPFIALLVSGGHTQLFRVDTIGDYRLLGESVDDAAGEAFDKIAQVLDLGYPGGPALAELAKTGVADKFTFPRPMLTSGDLNFSFSGLKTAVITVIRKNSLAHPQVRADIAHGVQEAIVDVLATKAMQALSETGLNNLVVAGGVGANKRLRAELWTRAERQNKKVYYPKFEFCTDNGAMIALAGALRPQPSNNYSFAVMPRWNLAEVSKTV